MRLVDLTFPVQAKQDGQPTVRVEKRHIQTTASRHVANVCHFSHDSMVGTYIDFPGHIEHTDDGVDAANCPIERLFRIDATVIHLDRADGSGKIRAEELAAACPDGASGGALILNALGRRRFDDIAWRSVYLGRDAVQWIMATGVHLFASDVYESDDDPQGVFGALFSAGVSTVCLPINLDKLTVPQAKLTVLTARFPGVAQLPCRVLAEVDS
jgi:kynurenine formamidase